MTAQVVAHSHQHIYFYLKSLSLLGLQNALEDSQEDG